MMNSLEVLQVIQGLSVPAFLVDVDHKVKSWNKACEELTGLTEEEVLDSSDHWRGFYSHKKETLADVVLKGACENKLEDRYHGKWSYLNESKEKVQVVDLFPKLEQRVLSFTAAPLRDRNGEVWGVIETVHDITQDNCLDRDLIYSRDNFRNLVASLRSIIDQLQYEKDCLEQNVVFNVKKNIMPYMDDLADKAPELLDEIEFIKKELSKICSGHQRKMVINYNFTPSEAKVVSYVKRGCRDKEIADHLNIALATVKKHKLSIRKKLNISKTPVSLSSHLNELSVG